MAENAQKKEDRQKAQEKFVILYDTAKKCLLILDQLYNEFEHAILKASNQDMHDIDPSIAPKIYISALGLIDYFHRFHEIISATPLLSKKKPELIKLGTVMKPVTNCRNYLQHMRGDLKGDTNYSILGSISWIHKNRVYTLSSNQPTPNSMPSIAYDRFEHKFVCKYQLTVWEHEIQLDNTYNEVKFFWSWLNKTISIEPSYIKKYAWGPLNYYHVDIKKVHS